jgi:hypothetical protein
VQVIACVYSGFVSSQQAGQQDLMLLRLFYILFWSVSIVVLHMPLGRKALALLLAQVVAPALKKPCMWEWLAQGVL